MARRRSSTATHLWGWLYPTRRGLPHLDLIDSDAIVGTGPECSLIIGKPEITGFDTTVINEKHFRILKKSDYVYIEDLSSNGTFIDGCLIGRGKKKVMSHNSKIACGNNFNNLFVFMDKSTCDMCNYPNELKEKYAISYILGAGGFGQVYLVFNKKLHKGYAMKALALNKEDEKYAKSEARILKSLKHQCVVSVEDIFATPSSLYLILELMEGGDLSQLIRPKLLLSESQTKLIFYQLTLAVEYLHKQGICHRDLKPENILLMEKKPETLIKVTDFGVSKNEVLQSEMDTIVGTPHYIAPEILSDGKSYTKLVDVWSMGVILFYCLSGTLPFQDAKAVMQGQYRLQKIPEKWAQVTFQAQELVDRMICRDVSRRITIKKILDYPWLKDDTMQNTARRLMGKKVVMHRRKLSVPGKLERPKSADLKPPIGSPNRLYSWMKFAPKTEKAPAGTQDKKPENLEVNANFRRIGSARQPAQPRGVMQFMRKENNPSHDKVVAQVKVVEAPKVPIVKKNQPSSEGKIVEPAKVPVPKRTPFENPGLRQARDNLKPVKRTLF